MTFSWVLLFPSNRRCRVRINVKKDDRTARVFPFKSDKSGSKTAHTFIKVVMPRVVETIITAAIIVLPSVIVTIGHVIWRRRSQSSRTNMEPHVHKKKTPAERREG